MGLESDWQETLEKQERRRAMEKEPWYVEHKARQEADRVAARPTGVRAAAMSAQPPKYSNAMPSSPRKSMAEAAEEVRAKEARFAQQAKEELDYEDKRGGAYEKHLGELKPTPESIEKMHDQVAARRKHEENTRIRSGRDDTRAAKENERLERKNIGGKTTRLDREVAREAHKIRSTDKWLDDLVGKDEVDNTVDPAERNRRRQATQMRTADAEKTRRINADLNDYWGDQDIWDSVIDSGSIARLILAARMDAGKAHPKSGKSKRIPKFHKDKDGDGVGDKIEKIAPAFNGLIDKKESNDEETLEKVAKKAKKHKTPPMPEEGKDQDLSEWQNESFGGEGGGAYAKNDLIKLLYKAKNIDRQKLDKLLEAYQKVLELTESGTATAEEVEEAVSDYDTTYVPIKKEVENGSLSSEAVEEVVGEDLDDEEKAIAERLAKKNSSTLKDNEVLESTQEENPNPKMRYGKLEDFGVDVPFPKAKLGEDEVDDGYIADFAKSYSNSPVTAKDVALFRQALGMGKLGKSQTGDLYISPHDKGFKTRVVELLRKQGLTGSDDELFEIGKNDKTVHGKIRDQLKRVYGDSRKNYMKDKEPYLPATEKKYLGMEGWGTGQEDRDTEELYRAVTNLGTSPEDKKKKAKLEKELLKLKQQQKPDEKGNVIRDDVRRSKIRTLEHKLRELEKGEHSNQTLEFAKNRASRDFTDYLPDEEEAEEYPVIDHDSIDIDKHPAYPQEELDFDAPYEFPDGENPLTVDGVKPSKADAELPVSDDDDVDEYVETEEEHLERLDRATEKIRKEMHAKFTQEELDAINRYEPSTFEKFRDEVFEGLSVGRSFNGIGPVFDGLNEIFESIAKQCFDYDMTVEDTIENIEYGYKRDLAIYLDEVTKKLQAHGIDSDTLLSLETEYLLESIVNYFNSNENSGTAAEQIADKIRNQPAWYRKRDNKKDDDIPEVNQLQLPDVSYEQVVEANQEQAEPPPIDDVSQEEIDELLAYVGGDDEDADSDFDDSDLAAILGYGNGDVSRDEEPSEEPSAEPYDDEGFELSQKMGEEEMAVDEEDYDYTDDEIDHEDPLRSFETEPSAEPEPLRSSEPEPEPELDRIIRYAEEPKGGDPSGQLEFGFAEPPNKKQFEFDFSEPPFEPPTDPLNGPPDDPPAELPADPDGGDIVPTGDRDIIPYGDEDEDEDEDEDWEDVEDAEWSFVNEDDDKIRERFSKKDGKGKKESKFKENALGALAFLFDIADRSMYDGDVPMKARGSPMGDRLSAWLRMKSREPKHERVAEMFSKVLIDHNAKIRKAEAEAEEEEEKIEKWVAEQKAKGVVQPVHEGSQARKLCNLLKLQHLVLRRSLETFQRQVDKWISEEKFNPSDKWIDTMLKDIELESQTVAAIIFKKKGGEGMWDDRINGGVNQNYGPEGASIANEKARDAGVL